MLPTLISTSLVVGAETTFSPISASHALPESASEERETREGNGGEESRRLVWRPFFKCPLPNVACVNKCPAPSLASFFEVSVSVA